MSRHRLTWVTDDAACLGMSLDIFVPPEGLTEDRRSELDLHAKEVCRSCPLLQQCADHAVGAREHYGTWGALTEHDRKWPITHGTRGGALTHRRRGEKPCDPCREAERARNREEETRRKARRKAA